MLTAEDIVTFRDDDPPPGQVPWVSGVEPPARPIAVVEPDPRWPRAFAQLAERIRGVLGFRVLELEHVGSTAVPELPAKPIIDVDLVVADSADEDAWAPALQDVGFTLRAREPWWYEHRLLTAEDPQCHLHVWSPGCPEAYRHRLFRDWLRRSAEDRELYSEVKRASARAATDRAESTAQYNLRKQEVLRAICGRAFAAAGLPAPRR